MPVGRNPAVVKRDRKRGRRWKWTRWSLRALLTIVLVATVAGIFHKTLFLRWGWPLVKAPLEDLLGLEVSLGGVETNWRGWVRLTDLEASRTADGAKPCSAIEHVKLTSVSVWFSPGGLLRGEPDWLQRVHIDEPIVRLDAKRSPLLPQLPESSSESDEAPAMRLPRFTLSGGRLEVGDNVLAPIALEGQPGEDWDIDVGLAGPHRGQLRVQVSPSEVAFDIAAGRLDMGTVIASLPEKFSGEEISGEGISGEGMPGEEISEAESPDAWRTLTGTLWGTATTRIYLPDAATGTAATWSLAAAVGGVELRLGVPDVRLGSVTVEARRAREAESFHGAVWLEELRFPGLPPLGIESDVLFGVFPDGLPDATGQANSGQANSVQANSVQANTVQASAARPRLELSDTLVRLGAAVASVDGSVDLSTFDVEHLEVVLDRLDVGSLSEWFPGLDLTGGTVDARLDFRGRPQDLATCDARLEAEASCLQVSANGDPIDARLPAVLSGCELRIDGVELERGPDRMVFVAHGEPKSPFEATLSHAAGQVGGVPFVLLESTAVRHDGVRFELESGRWTALGGHIVVAAEQLDSDGVLAFAGLDGFELETLRALALTKAQSAVLDPAGSLSGTAWVEASPRTRAGDVDLKLVGGACTWAGFRYDELTARWKGQLQGNLLALETLELRRREDLVRLSGSVALSPFDEQLPGEVAEWTRTHRDAGTGVNVVNGGEGEPGTPPPGEAPVLRLEVRVADLGALAVRQTAVRKFGGRLELSAELEGNLDGSSSNGLAEGGPKLTGRATLSGGEIRPHGAAPPLTDLSAQLRLDPASFHIEGFEGKIRGKPFRAKGQLDYSLLWPGFRRPPELALGDLDVHLEAQDALLVRESDIRARGNVDLRWEGPLERSTLSGQVEIVRAYYLRNIELASGADAGLPLELFSFPDAPLRNLQLDVVVHAERGLIVRNNLVATHANAQLHLGGTGFEPVLTGKVSTDEGTIRLGGLSKLEVEQARLDFLAGDPLNPTLDIALGQHLQGHDLLVTVTGTLRDPEVLLESSPPLPSEEVLVLVTTGQTMKQMEGHGVSRVVAIEAAKYLGQRLAEYLSTSDPTETTAMDRLTFEAATSPSRYHDDLYRVEYRVLDDLFVPQDHVFIQGERDIYGDLNLSAGIRFEIE